MPNQRPHVIYILSDEHRGQAMGHAGDVNLRTPVMDRMAAEGVAFGNAFSNCPVCTPARGTIFSGRHAHCGPVMTFTEPWKAAFPSTAHLMRQAGYHTAYFGKWHCGVVKDQRPKSVRDNPDRYGMCPTRTPERHRAGFEDWFASEGGGVLFEPYYYHGREQNPRKLDGFDTDAFTDLAIDYLQHYDREEPLFLVLSVLAPHFPLDAPEQWKRFDPKELVLRPNFRPQEIWGHDLTVEQLAKYYAMIENLDWNIGRLLETLDALPQFAGNTVEVYFSDHGDFMGCHGRSATKTHPHEEAVRIPMLFRGPGVIAPQPGRDEMMGLVDLQATIMGLLGLPVPPWDQGIDFSPALRGEAFTGPEAVLLEMNGNPHHSLHTADWRAVRTRDWKYAVYETGEELLFNLADDPYELQNLAGTGSGQKTALRTQLLQLLRDTREPMFDVILEHGIPPDHEDIDVSFDPEFPGSVLRI